MPSDKRLATILAVDDDKSLCTLLAHHLEGRSFRLLTAHDKAQALYASRRHRIEVVLLDQQLPDGRGVDLCAAILKQHVGAKIIFMTAYPSFRNAVDALKAGAHDYLSKPFELEELDLALNRCLRTIDLERVEKVQAYHRRCNRQQTVLVGAEGGLASVATLIERAAANQAPVLITGETGTGKGIVARYIHYHSSRQEDPFININCGALSEQMIESELFGHEKGAFTGADRLRQGVFEIASGGTLFLDEIGTLPFHLQSKLLGVLDDGMVRRLGGQRAIQVDARIIAATNIDLGAAFHEGRFREDLYYRIGVVTIHLPPLRERPQDIPALCAHFIGDIGGVSELVLAESEIAKLQVYHWPGNVRELRNTIERAIMLRAGSTLTPSRFLSFETPPATTSPLQKSTGMDRILTLDEVVRQHIQRTLAQCGGNRTRAAQLLGISRSTLKRKIRQLKGLPAGSN